jgi:hypothetical protein
VGRSADAEDWFVAALIVVIGLYVVGTMVTQLIAQSGLFGQLLIGGGVLAAIVGAAKKIFE